MYLQNNEKMAVFNNVSSMGIGGGFRKYFYQNQYFVDLGIAMVWYHNKEIDSGFNGLLFDFGLGISNMITENMLFQPSIGLNYNNLTGGTIAGDHVRLTNSLTGLGYNINLELLFML